MKKKQESLYVKNFTDKYFIKIYATKDEQIFLNSNNSIEVQLDTLPDIFTQQSKTIQLIKTIPSLNLELKLVLEYMWQYSPDRLKMS